MSTEQSKAPIKSSKIACTWSKRNVYKFGDNQIRFEDFYQPVGLKMDSNNRWVKKAETIPWEEIEKPNAGKIRV